MRLRKLRRVLLIAILIVTPVVAYFWSRGGIPSWSCLWSDVQIALAGPNQACWQECTSWSGDPCSGYSSCYNKNISCNGGVDQNGRNCQGCCFSCKTVCDDPDLPPTFTQTDLTCSQNGLNGWCVGTQSLDLTATESKGRNILISGDLPGDTFTCTEQASPASCSINLPEGNGGINYTAMSSIGMSTSGSTSWKRDATLPYIEGTATGTSGSNNWFVSNVEVSATVTETGSGLSSFDTSPDGATWTPYTTPLTFAEGTHNLQLRAIDNAGNQADTSVSLQVDTTPPTISGSLSGTLGGGNWYTSTVQASATASDAISGVASIEYSADGSGWQAYSSPVTFNDGSHTIQFRTYDVAGWSAETQTFSFQVDTIGPHIKLPGSWYIWETGEAIVKDDSSKIASVTIMISDPQGRWKKVEWHWTPNIHQFSNTISWNRVFADGIRAPIGTYNVTVLATDNAGNSSEKSARIIIPQPSTTTLPTPTPTSVPAVVVIETEPPLEPEAIIPVPPSINPELFEEAARKEISFSFSSPKSTAASTQDQNSNILWGATAAAAVGGFLAVIEAQRRAEEERKKKEAQASARRYNQRIKAYLQATRGKTIKPKPKPGEAPSPETIRRHNRLKKMAKEKARQNWLQQQTQAWWGEWAAQQEAKKVQNDDPYAGIGEWHERQDAANATVIAEFKEKERRARIQAAVNEIEAEKVIGYVDPEVEKARKNAELDSATQHYIAMGQTVENGEFSQDEYRRVQEAAHDNKPETKKKSWWQTNLGKFTLATTAVLTTMIGLQSLQGNSPPSTEYQYPWWCAHIPNPAKCIDDFRHYEETQWDQWVEEALYKASMPSFVFSPDISQQIVYPDEINGYPIVTRETQKAPDVVLIDSELGDDGPYDAIDNPAGYKIEDNPDAKYHTIVVHHTGSPERIAEMDVLRDYAYSLGSADIDYHFVIFPDGSIYEARDLRARGSHVNAAFDNDGNAIFGNSGTIGIAFVGCLHFQAGGTHNCPEDMLGDPTEDQIQSFDALTGLLTNSLSNLGCMAGHGEFPKQEGTNCPGNRCTPFVHEVAENYDLNHTNPAACYP